MALLAFYQYVQNVAEAWAPDLNWDELRWVVDGALHDGAQRRLGIVIGQAGSYYHAFAYNRLEGLTFVFSSSAKNLASLKPILERCKYQVSAAPDEEESVLLSCRGAGLPFITWLTRQPQPIRPGRFSLFDVGLLESLQIDCRGSCEVHSSIAVIHTGEVKSGKPDGTF